MAAESCPRSTPAASVHFAVSFDQNRLSAFGRCRPIGPLMRTAAWVKGFGRRPLARGGARHGEAGVRKPPKEETAFRKRRWRRSHDLWGFEDRSLSAPRS